VDVEVSSIDSGYDSACVHYGGPRPESVYCDNVGFIAISTAQE
jgi:hypothetical protein